MIESEVVVRIRQLYFAEHWKIGTIAAQLGLHPDTVRGAIGSDAFNRVRRERTSQLTEPYLDFIKQTLAQYPRLRATRIFQMIRGRGYEGSVSQLRRVIAGMRVPVKEAFLQLRTFPGEQGQADWAHFGEVQIGSARRRLSCFVITLSWSRALWLGFFFDQGLENLLRAHVEAFTAFGGTPRVVLYDNMKQVRLGPGRWNEAFLDFANHHGFTPKTHRPYRPRTKGKVERAVDYVKGSFLLGRTFADLEDLNAQAPSWLAGTANVRAHATTGRRPVDLLPEEGLTPAGGVPAYRYLDPVRRVVSFEATYQPITPIISNILFKNGVTFEAQASLLVEFSCPHDPTDSVAAAACPKQP